MKRSTAFYPVLACALLGGCTMIPPFSSPPAPTPPAWPNGPAYRDDPEDAAPAAELTWREFLRDPKLQGMVEMALENNRDLRLAALNVVRARAMYGIQRAEALPALGLAAAGAKHRASADLTQPEQPRTTESYAVDLGVASWEIDVFGRLRSLKEQALQDYLATGAACRGARLSLVTGVAGAYLAFAADREHLALAESTLTAQQDSAELVRKRYDAGVATELDLHRSRMQVDDARREIARYTQMVAQDRNALELLVGAPVPEDGLPASLADVASPANISAGLSSGVLLHRPDIMAAEHELRGAHAYIGVARAAFFPRISLTTLAGTASDELTGLLGTGSFTWSFAPRVSLPIFDARTWAAYRVSEATREIAVTRYEKSIQTAFREVADVLAVRGTVDRQLEAQESMLDSARKVHDLSEQLYNQGITGYLGVLDAQRSLYAVQQGLTTLRLVRLANQVRLYAVLGGGEGRRRPATDNGAPTPTGNTGR